MEEKAISVVMVDDDPGVMHILEDIFKDHPEIRFLGSAASAESFKSLVRKEGPDVALIDIYFGTGDEGIRLLEWIRRDFPGVKPIMLTAYDNKVSECYLKGACGFSKKGDWNALVPIIMDVHQGKTVIPNSISDLFVRQVTDADRRSQLISELSIFTDRELDVLRALAGGLSRVQIMKRLKISRFTVKRHSQNICTKCGGITIDEVIKRYQSVL